jgi:hypothetical protein
MIGVIMGRETGHRLGIPEGRGRRRAMAEAAESAGVGVCDGVLSRRLCMARPRRSPQIYDSRHAIQEQGFEGKTGSFRGSDAPQSSAYS